MSDITKLLGAYVKVAGEANLMASQQDPNDTRIEQMVKKHILELVGTGGANNQPMHLVNKAMSKAENFGCPPGWIHCGETTACVPEEVGC